MRDAQEQKQYEDEAGITRRNQIKAGLDMSAAAQIYRHLEKNIHEKQEYAFEHIQWVSQPDEVILANSDNKLIIRLNNSWRILAMLVIKEKIDEYGDKPFYYQWFVSAALVSTLSGKIKLASTFTRKERKYLIALTQALVYNVNKHPQWQEKNNFCIATTLCDTNDLEVIKVARAEYLASVKSKNKEENHDTVGTDNRVVSDSGQTEETKTD